MYTNLNILSTDKDEDADVDRYEIDDNDDGGFGENKQKANFETWGHHVSTVVCNYCWS